MKKFLGILISVCMLLGLMSFPAAAADGFDWQVQVTFDEEAGTATFTYTPPAGGTWVDMFILTSKPAAEDFTSIWNAYSGDSTTNGKIKREGSTYHANSRTVGALGLEGGYDEFEFVPGQTYYAYFATPVNGSAWEISKCFEFRYPNAKEFYIDCDTENMTANIYFEPNQGASWSEMGIYTEPQQGWNEYSSGKLGRLSNVVPTSLWRIGPSSMTDSNGLVDGNQVLDSHFEFTVGETYYIYMCYFDGSAWKVIPGYYEFVFGEGVADGSAFDVDELIPLSNLNNSTLTTPAGIGQYSETAFDDAAMTNGSGDYRGEFDQNIKRAASTLVFDIVNNAGEVGFSFQGYRWNGGTTDGNFYFTGEAEDCDGIYLIDRQGKAQRAEVVYSSSRYQVIIPEGFDGYLCIPTTRLGKSNDESIVGNYDHSNDAFILFWAPSIFLESKTENAASITMQGMSSLFYKVTEGFADAEVILPELIAKLPASVNAANYIDTKAILDDINELLTAYPELEAEYGAAYEAALAQYDAIAAVVADMDEAVADLAQSEMNEANEEAWKEAIKELYSIIAAAEENGVDITGLKDEADAYAADFEEAYGYAWNTVKPGDNGDNTGDFATLAFALAAVAGSGVIAVRRKRK